jgi:aminoglycoside phosphotransferase family enzyme/predicted kinase
VTTGEAHPALLDDLERPEAYPPPRPAAVRRVTTHISWVFLTDREAWKLKRPVDYGFVNYTTLERRRRCCEDEVRLNRRLAPDVYLGVVPVRRGPGGHGFGPEGKVVDHAVRMRRLAEEHSADARLRRDALTPDHLERLAERLARFFRTVAPEPTAGALERIRENLVENFAQAEPVVGRFVSREAFDAVRAWQLSALERHADRFRDRIARGRIRDGHGDLRLEHVYYEDGEPLVIDCVEFSERLRHGDVASDVAFLAMELTARSRADLAEVFLAAFAQAADDHDLYGVVDFYAGYRAWVRAKIAAFLAIDPSTPPDKAARKAEEARALFALARAYPEPRPDAPPVIAVGGLIGSGKSTLAEGLGRAAGVPVIASDRVRKALVGIGSTERAPAGASSAAVHGRRFAFVETTADDATLRARLRHRAAGPSVSDAGESLLEQFRATYEPVTELGPDEHIRVDTSGPTEAAVRAVRERLGAP